MTVASVSPDQTERSTRFPSEKYALFAIAGVFIAGWALVGPLRDVPVIDDWVYAWSVEHFLDTRRIEILEISSIYPVTQILWGAIFARVAGFSFGVLRLSTVVLAAIGCGALYLTFRELVFDRATSLIGALAVALDPVYFAMSFTFMTDVPFVSVSMIALFWYISGITRGKPQRLWVGSVFALAAFLIRPIGVVLPMSIIPAVLWRSNWRRTARQWVPPLAAALTAMPVALLVMSRTMGPVEYAALRVEQFQWWFTIPFRQYLEWNIELLFIAMFPFAPLFLAALARTREAIVVAGLSIVLVVVLLLIHGRMPVPLPDWQTWSLQDIAARTMIEGHLTPSAGSLRIAPIVRVAGVLSMAAVLIGCWRAARAIASERRPAVVLIALGILHLGLINLLWFYNDRYYLVLAPTFAYLGVSLIAGMKRAKWVAATLLSVWAVIAISGVRDMIDTNEASAAAARQLEREGVPPSQIDAGYANNGWRLYAHPEHLPPGVDRRHSVPFVTGNQTTQYSVANRILPGYDLVRVIPLDHAWWQVTDRLYVLRRHPDFF